MSKQCAVTVRALRRGGDARGGDGHLRRGVRHAGRPQGQAMQALKVDIQGRPLVPISARLELSLSPIYPNFTHGCVPKVLELSSNVDECKPLVETCCKA